MDLCGPMRVGSINGKRYVLVIVDDYSRYTLTHFLRTKDETPEVLIDFLRLVQRGLQAQVRVVRTDKGTKFLNQTLHAYFATEGIHHQTFVARTPYQNGIVERRNRTLVEAARTMLSAAKVPLFLWAEAIATACFTQNRSLVIPRHEKTPYHIINDRKPSVKFFHIFGSICFIVRDGENLDKLKENGDECIFVGYSNQSRAYRVFNKRTRVIIESIHVNFDELPLMASDQISSDPAPECQTMVLHHDSLSPAIQRQENVPQADKTVITSNELDFLFSPMFDELLNGTSKVVSKSSAVSAADAPNQRQQYTTPLNIYTTPAPTCQVLTLAPTVTSSENINQAETYAKNDQVADDETRRQLESNAEMCMFALTVSRTEPKNIKEAMEDSAWIESMQEELHQFDRLDSSEQRYFSERSRLSHINADNGKSKKSFKKQSTLLEKQMDESIPLDKQCQSSLEIFKVKSYVKTIITGVELCKQKIANRTYIGYIDPVIQSTIESNFCPVISRISARLNQFHMCLNEEMVADLRYFNSLESEVDSLRSQLKTQKMQFLNEIDRLSREYYYTDQMNAILGVISTTSVSRPQLKSNPQGDRVMHNNSQGKKQVVEDHRRSVKLSKHKTSVPACNDSLNAKTLNVKYVSAMCDKCVLIDKHAMCVLKSVAKPLKETVASDSNKNPINFTRKLYERVSKTCRWWYPNFTPSGYKWKPKSGKQNVNPNLVEIVLFIVDFGCSNHMTRNLKLLINFVEKFLGMVKFGNDQIAPILGNGDLVQGAVTIKRFYYVKGLNHNLFSVGQFCDVDLEVSFRKSTCYIHDLKGNDLLTGSRGMDLYSITLQDTNCPNPICLMAKASSSQAWLWHRCLSHLNFDTINLLSKNDIVVGLPKLKFVKDHLCSSCELGKAKRKLVQRGLQAQVRVVQTDKGMKFLNQTLHAYFAAERILHQTDGENLDKMKEKGNECIFVGYSNQLRAYRVFNKRTKVIMESIHVNFDELPYMASDQLSSDPAPKCQTMALNHDGLSLAIQRQENVTQADRTVTTSNELDLLFSPMFDELLNGSSKVVSKSSAVSAADDPLHRQNLTTPLNIHTTPAPTCQVPTLAPTVSSSENINQAETYTKNDQVLDDEFINIFSTSVQDQGETSSRHIDSSNMHTFYQRYPSEHR
nr:hypothetical protein [Tanacetum cinerariifolium]